MLQAIPSFYAKISEKNLFISANANEKYVVCNDYFIIHHNDKMRFYPLANFVLYYLENLRNWCMNWIYFASPFNAWTDFIPCSTTDSAEKLLQRVDKCLIMCNEQLTSITETREWTEGQAFQRRGSCRESSKTFFFRRQKPQRPVVQCLQKELKKSKRLNLNRN